MELENNREPGEADGVGTKRINNDGKSIEDVDKARTGGNHTMGMQ